MRVEIDFDNTLACYDQLFRDVAVEWTLLSQTFSGGKKELRDTLRQQANGEATWTRLQAEVYGRRMVDAQLIEGALPFAQACRQRGVDLCVISHKTRFAAADPDGFDLHQAALAWMEAHGFFRPDGFGLSRDEVFFEPTRVVKCQRIRSMGCSHFVDDLEEIFHEPEFPANVERLLLHRAAMPRHADPLSPLLTGTPSPMPSSLLKDEPTWAVAAALAEEPLLTVEPQRGGGNNRLFCITTSRGTRYALKQYARSLNDPRDRLAVEFGALDFLNRCGLREIPLALAADTKNGFALYEWIDGDPIATPQADDIDAALRFLGRLQDQRRAPTSSSLALASEACLSGTDIVTQVDRRIDRLAKVAESEPELRSFLNDHLMPLWTSLTDWSSCRYREVGLDFATPVAVERRALSPSDFGFHNAIRRPDGRIAFVDFEYFGWDDPVKLVADFLHHPGMTLSPDLQTRFRDGAMTLFDNDKTFATRLGLLYPLFGLRWCTILLNEFLPERWQSRVFAHTSLDRAAAIRTQLDKARARLSVVRSYWMNYGGS